MTRRYVYLASITDAAAIGGHLVDAHHSLPPPGLELRLGASKMPAGIVSWPVQPIRLPVYVEVPEPGDDVAGWWWTDVGQLLLELSDVQSSALGTWLLQLAEKLGRVVGSFLDAIVVMKGQGPENMRWLETTLRGNLFGEQFQHHLSWGNPGADPTTSEADALVLAETIADAWSVMLSGGPNNAFSADVVYTEVGVVELNQSDPGGDVSESYGTQWFMWPTGSRPAGVGVSVSLPYEVACCVSLQTDHRGASGKGRFYLPPFTKDAMASHGLWSMGVVSPVIVAIGSFIDSVKGTTDLKPIVVSRAHRILNEVTSIRCGVVPDSQRRRRRSLSEAYVAEWAA